MRGNLVPMALRMWTLDLAREQCAGLDHLRRLCDLTLEAGYNAFGLYLEHRFAYPSAPWAQGKGCLTPEMVRALQSEYRTLQIVPFINLLGHFEGFLYTEEGTPFAELAFKGLQACPSKPAFVYLAHRLLQDTLEVFESSLIHIGGDETQHLGACPDCRARVKEFEKKIGVDGKARIFADHFAPLVQQVVDAGRRPALWGDMLLAHPEAMAGIDKSALIFDWQYFQGPGHTGHQFQSHGFDVVYCPTLHTYNATWLHLPQSERNVVEHVAAAHADHAYGVCLTTWECGLFGNCETLLPAIRAAGEVMLNGPKIAADLARKANLGKEIQLEAEIAKDLEATLAVPAGVADGILTSLMDRRASEAVLLLGPRELTVMLRIDDTQQEPATIPLETGAAVLRRLATISGMASQASSVRRTGAIRGTYKEVPFAMEAVSEPTKQGVRFVLTMTPWTSTTAYGAVRGAENFLGAYLADGETAEKWARLMGIDLLDAGPPFEFGGIRSGIKCRMLLYSNPFLLWLRHRELCGPAGDRALAIFEQAVAVAPDASMRGVADFAKSAIQFVRFAEEAHQAYRAGNSATAATALHPCRQIFENLVKIARSNNLRCGGSLADIERCQTAKEHVERVMRRIREYGDGSLGYRPSFEMITHPQFVPHDQAAWWLINSWARE